MTTPGDTSQESVAENRIGAADEDDQSRQRRPTLWRDGAFVRFWLARTVSVSGSTITLVVLPILVYQMTGSAFATSLLATCEAAPYLLFGLIAGAFADRLNRQKVMVSCDALNTVLLACIPLAAAFHRLNLPLIYVVALASASAFVWFDAASFGALPTLVGQERIVSANSALATAETIAAILGPTVAGALTARIGPASAISFDAGSYALSATLLATIPRMFNAERASPTGTVGSEIRQTLTDIREGVQFLRSQRLVRTLTLLVFGLSFSGGAVTGLLVVYGEQALGLAHDDAGIGLLFTMGAIGSLFASLLLPFLNKRAPIGWLVVTGLSLNALLLLGLVVAPNLYVAAPILLVWELSYSLVTLSGIALRQLVTPERLQSRVNATARLIAWGGAPLGAAVGGAIAGLLSIRVGLFVMMVGVVVSALVGWRSSLWRRQIDETSG